MKPLRILYDFEAFSDQSYGGISRYILELAKRIEASEDTVVELFAGWHRNQYLRTEKPEWASGRFFPAWPKTGEIRRRLNALLTKRAIARFRPDIVHRTYHRHAADYPGSHAIITTIHDLTYFLYPGSFPDGDVVRRRLLKVAQRSNHLPCDSENTRQDAVKILGINEDRTSVIHLGVNPPSEPMLESPLNSKFLLYVGQRGGYKNSDLLLRAIAREPRLNQLQIVLFGGGPLVPDEQFTISKLGLTHRVVPVSGSDRTLAQYYYNAEALVYPSLYEGFGIPVLEAMIHGCPVVCSGAGSLTEVAGDAAEFVRPDDPQALANAITCILTDENRRRSLVARGKKRALGFTWDACAGNTLSLYRSESSGGSPNP